MVVNVIESKLSAPKPLRNAIERRLLIKSVDEAKDANLILLIAPAGYGKTTLAQQILASRPNSRNAWYHLDDSDAHPDQFIAYLVAALLRVLPKLNATSPGSDIRQTIEDVCFAIEQYEGPRSYLVLDNWECVDHNRDIASILPLLARSGRGRLTVIIASRIPPSFKTRRDQTRGSILRLDAAQLAFSLPECQEALRLRFGRDLDDDVLERFWRETSGWCVSVGLLPSTLPRDGFAAVSQSSLSPTHTGAFQEYFTEEVYESLSPDFARFLCETSLFDVLTAERCAAVVSTPERVEESLDELSRSAIPHVVLEQPAHYRLHALAKQAFRSHLADIVKPVQVAALYRSTSEHYLKEGLIFEAIGLLMELGDYDRALDLMDTKWSDLYGQHGWIRVRQWLEALPAEYHNRAAFVKTYSNVLNVSGDNKGAIAFLKDKLSPERFSNDIESFGSLWANYWWARVNTEPGPHYDAAKKDHDSLTSVSLGFSPTMLGIFQNTLGMAAYLELRLREAIAHVRKAAELVEEPYLRLRIIANQNEALYSHLLGDSITALDDLKQVRDDCHRMGLQSQVPKMYMLEANIHLAMGYYRDALHDIDQCVASMREFGGYSLQLDIYVGRFRGIALWYLGDRAEGLRLLMAAQEPAKQFGVLTGTEVALLCEYYSLLDGHPEQVVSDHDIPDRHQPSECRLIYLALNAFRSFQGKSFSGLKRRATQIRDLATSCEMPQWVATGSFLLAMSPTRSADNQRLKDLLLQALGLLKKLGWRSYPMSNNTITSFVTAKATRLGIDATLVEPLLSTGTDIDLTPAFDAELKDSALSAEERIRLWEAASRLSIRGLSTHAKRHMATVNKRELRALRTYHELLDHCPLPPLHVVMLGGFSVSAKGRIVRFNRSSSRLLFQHLLVNHPRKMHEEELIEYLWPETDPTKSRASLRTTVKDLRKALDPYAVPRGSSYVAYAEQHYGLELPPESHVDYLDFTNLIQACVSKEVLSSVAISDRIAELRLALETYRGPLLPMLPYEAFTIEPREQLQAQYQRGSLELAELLAANKCLGEAGTVVERALAYDQLWTDGVRLLLQIYVMQKEFLKAMRVYRSYEKRLREELAIAPDEDIRDYFDLIMKSSMG
ncbi:MAG: BTAD domain-containing putative transcriptional regulator [Candidatus Zixiibacteriota bacterium]